MNVINCILIFVAVVALIFSSSNDKTFNIQRSKLLKAILPYGIIVGHISAYNTAVFNVAIVGSFIVGVFFFISAYGLECKRQAENIKIGGLWSRIFKLLLPLVVPIILYVDLLILRKCNAELIVAENMRNYQLILPFTWFIIVLAIFYAFFYIISSIKKITNIWFFIILFISVCVFSLANFILFRDSAYTNFSSLCFPAGVLYRQHETKIKDFLSKKYNYIICFVVLLATGLIDHVHYLLPFTILIWSIVIIMLSTLFNVSSNKVLNFFSDISYEVYICQGIAFLFIPQHFDKYNPIVHIALTIILTIVIATLCHFATWYLKRIISAIKWWISNGW